MLRLLISLAAAATVVAAHQSTGKFHTKPSIAAAKFEAVEKMRMGKDSFDAVHQLHNQWFAHSVKALLVQMSKQLVMRLNKDEERSFILCLHRIKEKTDLIRSCKCLVEARDALEHRTTRRDAIKSSSSEPSAFVQELRTDARPSERTPPKLAIKRLDKQSPARVLPWWKRDETTQVRVKRSEHRLVPKNGLQRRLTTNSRIIRMRSAPALKSAKKSPVQEISKMILRAYRAESNATAPRWTDTYKSILMMKKKLDASSKGPGARVFDLPMKDLVLDSDRISKKRPAASSSTSMARSLKMPPIIQQAFSLADSVRAHSSKTGQDVNYKYLSPRFAPLLPDKNEGRGLLSPSVLSFYKDDAEDQIAPIPDLLDATGMNKADRESMLEVIMEVSGARETVDEAFKTLKKLNLFGMEGDVLEATKKISENFKDLERSFTRRQKAQMKRRKFAFLNKDQLESIYAKQGMKKEHYEDFDLENYGGLSHRDREQALWKRIELIARNDTVAPESTAVGHSRSKRQVVIPGKLYVLSPTVLAPYMFTPIYGLSILGPTVLSPSLFSPLILNPSVLSPYVLSPAVGMPFILSPYVLSPYVLSPLVFAPFILTPYVLSPNVLNPYVLSPLVLSPVVLCPDVISPMTLGGNILSPTVASPAFFTKNAMMAVVLSPSVFS